MIWINEPSRSRPKLAPSLPASSGGGAENLATSIDRAVMASAGLLVLASLLLSVVHSPYWLWLTAFLGANMLQASFTGFCPAAMFFKWLGLPRDAAFS